MQRENSYSHCSFYLDVICDPDSFGRLTHLRPVITYLSSTCTDRWLVYRRRVSEYLCFSTFYFIIVKYFSSCCCSSFLPLFLLFFFFCCLIGDEPQLPVISLQTNRTTAQFDPDRVHIFWSFCLRNFSHLIFWFGPNKAGVKSNVKFLSNDSSAPHIKADSWLRCCVNEAAFFPEIQ